MGGFKHFFKRTGRLVEGTVQKTSILPIIQNSPDRNKESKNLITQTPHSLISASIK